MKPVKLFSSEGLYMIRSISSANSMYFRNKTHKNLAKTLLDKWLGDMIDVHAYSFTPIGWSLIFKTKASQEIIKAFEIQYAKSKKAKPSCKIGDVEHMISEHFRHYLSELARKLNEDIGRKGSLVEKRMEKFIFEDEADFLDWVGNLESNELMAGQKLAEFQPDMATYDDTGMKELDSEIRNSSRCNLKSYGMRTISKKLLNCFIFVLDKLVVVRQWIEATLTKHFPQNPQFPHPKLE